MSSIDAPGGKQEREGLSSGMEAILDKILLLQYKLAEQQQEMAEQHELPGLPDGDFDMELEVKAGEELRNAYWEFAMDSLTDVSPDEMNEIDLGSLVDIVKAFYISGSMFDLDNNDFEMRKSIYAMILTHKLYEKLESLRVITDAPESWVIADFEIISNELCFELVISEEMIDENMLKSHGLSRYKDFKSGNCHIGMSADKLVGIS